LVAINCGLIVDTDETGLELLHENVRKYGTISIMVAEAANSTMRSEKG
jgi:hypothetical protein